MHAPLTADTTFQKTPHFTERQGRRGVRDAVARLAIACGRCFYEGDDRVYFLGRDAIRKRFQNEPPSVVDVWVRRGDGVVVVVAPGDRLVTTYRNPHFLRTLKRRPLQPLQKPGFQLRRRH